jgi:hypothetical protein
MAKHCSNALQVARRGPTRSLLNVILRGEDFITLAKVSPFVTHDIIQRRIFFPESGII